MRQDPAFPFVERDLERHLRYLYHLGSRSIISDVLEDLRDQADVNNWITEAVAMFPTVELLQHRLERMLGDFTSEMPANHLYKYYPSPRALKQFDSLDVETEVHRILQSGWTASTETNQMEDEEAAEESSLVIQRLSDFWREVARNHRLSMLEFHSSSGSSLSGSSYFGPSSVKKKKKDFTGLEGLEPIQDLSSGAHHSMSFSEEENEVSPRVIDTPRTEPTEDSSL